MKILALTCLFGLAHSFAALAASPPLHLSSGNFLVNRDNMTVYVYDKDSKDTSNCYGGCAQAWPPVLVTYDDELSEPYGSTTRKEGTKQVTYQGHPVYLFVEDVSAGDKSGDGYADVWHIINN